MMYEYGFVKVAGDGVFGGNGFTDHRSVIRQYAAEGYRYVGYVPICIGSNGVEKDIDLIFERVVPGEPEQTDEPFCETAEGGD